MRGAFALAPADAATLVGCGVLMAQVDVYGTPGRLPVGDDPRAGVCVGADPALFALHVPPRDTRRRRGHRNSLQRLLLLLLLLLRWPMQLLGEDSQRRGHQCQAVVDDA